MPGFRKLKTRFQQLLQSDDWQQQLTTLDRQTPKELIGPLFSLLLHSGELRWHAVTALGLTVARMADERMEDARVVMRRLIWNLSEESGNLGWGAPEAMGEIMAQREKLAKEYNRCLISYILQTGRDDNFMDHLPLRRGAYWGVARLAQARPELALPALTPLMQGLEHPRHAPPDLHESPDAEIHGLSAWAVGSLAKTGEQEVRKALPLLEKLQDKQGAFTLYRDRELGEISVGALVGESLERVRGVA